MDQTGRKITKIAREVGKFTVQTMKEEGIGTAEFDFIHLVRHNPGITQTEVRETLKIDKGAAAEAGGKPGGKRVSREKAESGGWKKPAALRDKKGGGIKEFEGEYRGGLL